MQAKESRKKRNPQTKLKETDIRNSILEFISYHPHLGAAWVHYNGAVFDKKHNCYRKRSKYTKDGVSDIVGWWGEANKPKRPLFIEVKAPGRRASPAQKSFIEEACANGAVAFICDNLREAVIQLQMAIGI